MASLTGKSLPHRVLNLAEFAGTFHHFKEALPAALKFPQFAEAFFLLRVVSCR